MKKIILAAFSGIVLSVFIACSADTIANVQSTESLGPTGIIKNDKGAATPTTQKKSSSSSAKSSSSSADDE